LYPLPPWRLPATLNHSLSELVINSD
jgi:hypothetical protein